MRSRRTTKLKVRLVTLSKKRVNPRKKIQLQLWRRRFIFLYALHLTRKIAKKRRKNFQRQKKSYLQSRRLVYYRKDDKVRNNGNVIKLRGTQFTTTTVLTYVVRKNAAHASRQRVLVGRRRLRALVRAQRRMFSRTGRSLFKRIRKALLVSRRLHYLSQQRKVYRRVNLQLATGSVKGVTCSDTHQSLVRELRRVRRARLRRLCQRRRYAARVRAATRLRRTMVSGRHHKHSRKLHVLLTRRVTSVTRISSRKRGRSTLLVKNFRAWQFLSAAFRRAHLKFRHKQRRRRRIANKKFQKEFKKRWQVKTASKKTLEERARKKTANKRPIPWQISRWKCRGRFVVRRRRRMRRISKRQRARKRLKVLGRKFNTKQRRRRAYRLYARHRLKNQVRTRRRAQRGHYKLYRLHSRMRNYVRKIKDINTAAFTTIRRSRSNIQQYKTRKFSKWQYRKLVARKRAKNRAWLCALTRKTKIASIRVLVRSARATKYVAMYAWRTKRKKLLTLLRAAVRTRVHSYQQRRLLLYVKKSILVTRQRTYAQPLRKPLISRGTARDFRKFQGHKRYVHRGIRNLRRLIRPYGPLKFLRWRRGPRRFISWRSRRSARPGYARIGTQFKRGLWTRRHRDRIYARANPVKPRYLARQKKQKYRRALRSALTSKKKPYRYQLKPRKLIRAPLPTDFFVARWVAKRRRPKHVTMRTALKAARKSLLKDRRYEELRKFVRCRVASRRTLLFGRAYKLNRPLNPRDRRFRYRPTTRFTLRGVITAKIVYRIRTRRRRRARRRRYHRRRKHPAVLDLSPTYNRRPTSAVLVATRSSVLTLGRSFRQLLRANQKSTILRKLFSPELQKELLVSTQGNYRRKLTQLRSVTAFGTRRVPRKTQRAVCVFLKLVRRWRKRWAARLKPTGRGYLDPQRNGSRYSLRQVRRIMKGKRKLRKTLVARHLRKQRAWALETWLLIGRWRQRKKADRILIRSVTRHSVRSTLRRERYVYRAVKAAVVYETTLENDLNPVLDWFVDETNEKIYSNLEIETPTKEVLVRGKKKKICT